MATVRNIVIEQGANFSMTVDVEDITEVPIDLSAYTYRSQIRRSYYSQTAIDFTCFSATPTSGVLALSLTTAQTTLLKPGRYVYDLLIIDANKEATRILEGIVVVNPLVTQVPTTTTTTV